jgi:hypothetical protein
MKHKQTSPRAGQFYVVRHIPTRRGFKRKAAIAEARRRVLRGRGRQHIVVVMKAVAIVHVQPAVVVVEGRRQAAYRPRGATPRRGWAAKARRRKVK